MNDIVADIRNRVVASQAMIKLCAKGLKTESQALIEIARNLQLIYEMLKNLNGKK